MVRFLFSLCVFILLFPGQIVAQEASDIFKVRKINVQGNKVTKTSIILREIVFTEGEMYNSSNMDEMLRLTKSNITNTNLFLEVELTPLIDSVNHLLDLNVIVKERWFFAVFPHVDFADRSFNEWWYERNRDLRRITYGAKFRHYNFSGNSDVLGARVYMGFAPMYQLSYSRPYIDKRKRFGVSASAFYTSQKSLGYKTWNDKIAFYSSDNSNVKRYGGAIDFRYRKNHNYFHTFYFGYSNSSVSDSIVVRNPEYFGGGSKNQSLFSLGYEYRMDYRDVRQYPLKGNLFIGSVVQYIATGGKSQTNLQVRYNHYFPLSNRLFFETSFRGKLSLPREQSYFLVSGLGYGENLVRGYELYVIDGQYFALSRNTFKVLAYQKKFNLDWLIKWKQFSTVPVAAYPNIFVDYGYVRNFNPERSNSHLGNKSLVGLGLGLDVVTFYNFNIRGYYSINQMREGKLFLSVSRDF